ncbi:hypothetical protein GN244_ATG06875 [Phytophthora infestans]|uniref:Uncharacterized protein n=1 Tax=Phytophthora infestans TaxID=4787 RepID=A0A833WG35_PHYIN|nr:hypothetical protein GN244_ATG06875 [Phytophthora infestans]
MSWSNRATANGQSTNLSCSDDKQNDSQEQLMDSIETEHAYMIHEAVVSHEGSARISPRRVPPQIGNHAADQL